MQKLAAVYNVIQTDYVTPPDSGALMASCMKGMVHGLDEHSSYYDQQALEDLTSSPSPDAVGIGVELVLRAGLPTVLAATEGSPADQAGLRPKDYILEIDGQSMEESSELQSIQTRLRGKPGSTVKLLIRRPGETENRSLTLVRQATRAPGVVGRRANADIGYLRIRSVNERTPQEVRTEFRKLHEGRPLRGLVIDLRNSPGGLLNASIELAAMFLPSQAIIVSTEGRLPEAKQTIRADRDQILRGLHAKKDPWPEAMQSVPLIVLTSAGTSAGAEIIAAALHDHGRARLVGDKTFGRGTIQTVRYLSKDSAIKLTTAYVLTPAGRRLQGRGLEPDVPAPNLERSDLAGTDQDPGLNKAIALLRSP